MLDCLSCQWVGVKSNLLAIVLRVWAALHATPDDQIAAVIASEVEAQPIFDRELAAAVVALYVVRESGIRMHPEAYSWDAAAGVSCGLLQEPCAFVHVHPGAREQIRYWLSIVVHHGLAAVDSSPTRASRRVSLAMRLMAE